MPFFMVGLEVKNTFIFHLSGFFLNYAYQFSSVSWYRIQFLIPSFSYMSVANFILYFQSITPFHLYYQNVEEYKSSGCLLIIYSQFDEHYLNTTVDELLEVCKQYSQPASHSDTLSNVLLKSSYIRTIPSIYDIIYIPQFADLIFVFYWLTSLVDLWNMYCRSNIA